MKVKIFVFLILINKVINAHLIDTSEYITGDYNQNLCIASYYGYEDEVLRLINNGADINCDCGNGVTPILYAIEKNNYKLVELFLKNNAKVDINPQNGISSLHASVLNGNIEIIELLLKNGADLEIKDYNGATPLMYAIVTDQLDIMKYLLKKGSDINTIDYLYNTLLHVATYVGNFDIVRFLIEKGVDINTKNYYGYTALHIAVEYGYYDIAKFLIDNGADINIKNNDNYTPLHIAILSRDTFATNFLVDQGSNCNEKIKTSINSIELARFLEYDEMVNLLKSKKCSRNLFPFINKYSAGFEFLTSSNDLFYSFNIKFTDMKFNYSINSSFAYRPYNMKVKSIEGNTYYYENRQFLNFGLSKNFNYKLRKNFSFILSSGCALNYSFASYIGTMYKPENIYNLSFNFTFAFDYNMLTIETGYRYLDFKIMESSKHWFNFGIYLNVNRKFKIPHNHKIQWIEDLL